MTNTPQKHSPDALFGIEVGDRRSRCWRVRSGAHRPELFIEREQLEDVLHVSLHESGKWHLKVENRKVRRWVRPPEVVTGFTRAVVIIVPPSVATMSEPAHADAVGVALEKNGEESASFAVVIERPGADLASWPGKNVGSQLVARLPLAQGAGTCCVVVDRIRLDPGTATFRQPTEEQLARMRGAAERGELFATLFGEEPDGALSILDVRAERPHAGEATTTSG